MTQIAHGPGVRAGAVAAPARHPGSLLTGPDLGKDRFLRLVELAAELKRDRLAGAERPRLTGCTIALAAEDDATCCAFEVAAHEQGAHATRIDPAGSHPGRDGSVPDTARVLGRIFDGIASSGSAHETVEQLADHAGVPVWNGLTGAWHPTQVLADVLTMMEHRPLPPERISCCFLGDGRTAIARSLLVTGAMLGMDVRIAAPRALWPPADVVATARGLAAGSGATVLVTDDPGAGVGGADFVYTAAWVGSGVPAQAWAERIPLLLPYRVTGTLMAAAGPDARFLHCLPAVHDGSTELGRRLHGEFGLDGAEVTDEVFGSSRSIVFDQAENRMHAIKAVLVAGLAR